MVSGLAITVTLIAWSSAALVHAADPGTAELTRVAAGLPREAPAAALRGGGGVRTTLRLPTPLSWADQRLYRQAFVLQEQGDWAAAARVADEIGDRRLLGHLEAHRLLSPLYKASYDELRRWLNTHADHADAAQVYRAAMARRGKSAPPRPPDFAAWSGTGGDPVPHDRDWKPSTRAAAWALGRVRHALRQGSPVAAAKLLTTPRVQASLDPISLDRAWTMVAAGYFFAGAHTEALRVATAAARRSGDEIPEAQWYAGLSAFRLGDWAEAGRQLTAVARSEVAGDWTRSAGAYWASRAMLRQGEMAEVTPLLRIAARFPRTFYGQLATRALGIEQVLNWELPPLTDAALAALATDPAARRAFALLQIGQSQRAELELRIAYLRGTPDTRKAILSIAATDRMPGLAMALGWQVWRQEGQLHDAAFWPVPDWEPRDGFRVDRALIFALMRQESRFQPKARSHMGAQGLMQVMPKTARGIRDDRPDLAGPIYEPATNMAVGQAVVEELMQTPGLRNTLFHVVAGYNAGPAHPIRWDKPERHGEDPLMFVESISIEETREYVQRVFTNFWIYRERLGQPSVSLDAVVANDWPRYAEEERGLVAARE